MKIRPYQQDCADAIFREWEKVQATLAVLPTGMGKTRVASEVIQRLQPKRVLFLAHREELIFQAQKQIKAATGLDSEIEMGDLKANTSLKNNMPVMISTIQTQIAGKNGGRMTKFRPSEFGAIIIDEAHRSTCVSYKKILDYYKQNPAIKILGITATPDRTDESALGAVFESVAYSHEMVKGIEDGWLVPIRQQIISIGSLDYSHVRTTAGDLNGADLAAVMEDEKALQGVVGASLEIIGEKKAIAFCSSVRHAQMCCAIFNRSRQGRAAWVCGETPTNDRRFTLKEFTEGRVQILCNVGITTEGFDCPDVEFIVMGRPTKSRLLYTQMCGRGTRSLPGTIDGLETADERKAAIASSAKPHCTILDFVGNSGKLKLITTADILGGKYPEEVREMARKKAEKSPRDMSELLAESEDEIRKRIEAQRAADDARKARLLARVQFTSREVNPFSLFGLTPVQDSRWDRGKILSEKCRSMLVRMGVNPDRISYAHGMQLVNNQMQRWKMNLCTAKQANLLIKHGYPDAAKMTMKDASKAIDEIANNGWKRPSQIERKDVPMMAMAGAGSSNPF